MRNNMYLSFIGFIQNLSDNPFALLNTACDSDQCLRISAQIIIGYAQNFHFQ